MRLTQTSNNPGVAEAPARHARQTGSSEALQDLIDILKQNYVSDCPSCAGTGFTLQNRACKPCMGFGKSKAP